jgi:hypothetical protein
MTDNFAVPDSEGFKDSSRKHGGALLLAIIYPYCNTLFADTIRSKPMRIDLGNRAERSQQGEGV